MVAQLHLPALTEQFEKDGYLLIPNALPAEQVERLNLAIDRIIAEEPESLAYNVYHSVESDPAILELIDHPQLLPLMVKLLGYNIQLHISHLTVRKPNPADFKTATSSFINWHQDGPHPSFPAIGGLTSTYYIKICYILSDMSEPNRGNTKVIPGSHRIPDFKPNDYDVNTPVEGEVAICGKPGDAFIFPQNLWHAGSPNRTEGFERRQLFIGYSPIWMRPIDYHTASEQLLAGANPLRRQLLGDISTNYFNYYVPNLDQVPLKQYSDH
ncbi:phytanoyl-CoA dioxygenase family protein [Paenibacillus sp. GCM10027626]|uniref:phytanoyl-CoA dioxygenase family protein n=1 Tax=Paenibacillus sp. GCM10027626 TaxID=3273411 RepID=UPI003641D726